MILILITWFNRLKNAYPQKTAYVPGGAEGGALVCPTELEIRSWDAS